MGKTQSGAVWLDPNKTSPFDFYQYWRNVADADVLKCIRMLTFLPLEEIDKMDSWEGAQLNTAKEILAYELTKLVHGEEEAKKAQESARALFSKGNAAEMPTAQLTEEDLTDGKIDILTMLVKSGLVTSKSEARRAVQQGGVAVDGEKVSDIAASFGKEELSGEGIILKKGKKLTKKALLSTAEAKYSKKGYHALALKLYQNKNAFDSRIKTQARVFLAKGKGKKVSRIAGIQKIGTYEMSITTNGYCKEMSGALKMPICALHYYGDTTKYDYEHYAFGFTRGDISSVLALENSGVEYKYPDGTKADIFDILSGAGINYVRIRIWNNPYDII